MARKHIEFSQIASKVCHTPIEPSTSCQIVLKFCQIGDISPNLVTLILLLSLHFVFRSSIVQISSSTNPRLCTTWPSPPSYRPASTRSAFPRRTRAASVYTTVANPAILAISFRAIRIADVIRPCRVAASTARLLLSATRHSSTASRTLRTCSEAASWIVLQSFRPIPDPLFSLQ